MASYWVTNGYHVRHHMGKASNGAAEMQTQIFKPGDRIEPTEWEKTQFKNKFKYVTDQSAAEPEAALDYTRLETAKTNAQIMLANPPEGVEIGKKQKNKLNNYISQNPGKQENIDKLADAIDDLLTEISIQDTGKAEGAE